MSYVLPCALSALAVVLIVRFLINKLARPPTEMANLANVFRIHYFLYWGSISAVLNYSVLFIVKHGGVGKDQTAILYLFLPMAMLLTKPLFCSIADKYIIHEWILVVAIAGLTVSYGLLTLLPFITLKHLIWPLFCVLMVFGNIFQGVLTSITDSLVLKVAELEGSNFGKIRVWGTIGWGLMSLLIGWLNELDTRLLPRYVPGLLLFIGLGLIDCILMLANLKKLRMQHLRSDQKRERRPTLQETIEQSISTRASHFQSMSQSGCQSSEHVIDRERVSTDKQTNDKQICKFVLLTCYHHPKLIKHIVICVVIGMLTALHWNFFPVYLEEQLTSGDSSLVGYASMVQCFAGEMPFMYFAELIVRTITLDISLSLVLLAFSFRYALYTLFTPSFAYYILFVEVLHGVTFGLFYYCMNMLAHDYSKKMLRVEFDYLMKNVYNRSDLTVESSLESRSTVCEGIEVQEEPGSRPKESRDEILEEIRQETQEKTSIRLPEGDESTAATMQGVLSASYEGFGVGLGSLVSGFAIQHFGWHFIWNLTSGTAFVVFAIDILLMTVISVRNKMKRKEECRL